jgi:hypothetical protein
MPELIVVPRPIASGDPTTQTYTALNEAFSFFNARLFQGRLPHCLLTVRNHGKALGYFGPERFGTDDGDTDGTKTQMAA